MSFGVQPQVRANLATHLWGCVFATLALAGLLGVRRYVGAGEDGDQCAIGCA